MVYTKQYYVYIITNYHQTTFYIGITNNLEQRIWQHKNKTSDGFSSKYNLNRLVYYECFDDVNYAIKLNVKKLIKFYINYYFFEYILKLIDSL